MTFDGEGKSQPPDPETMVRLLEIELMQKRAERRQNQARRSSFRVASFLFLFVVLAGAAFALWFALSSGHLDEARAQNQATPTVAPIPNR